MIGSGGGWILGWSCSCGRDFVCGLSNLTTPRLPFSVTPLPSYPPFETIILQVQIVFSLLSFWDHFLIQLELESSYQVPVNCSCFSSPFWTSTSFLINETLGPAGVTQPLSLVNVLVIFSYCRLFPNTTNRLFEGVELGYWIFLLHQLSNWIWREIILQVKKSILLNDSDCQNWRVFKDNIFFDVFLRPWNV